MYQFILAMNPNIFKNYFIALFIVSTLCMLIGLYQAFIRKNENVKESMKSISIYYVLLTTLLFIGIRITNGKSTINANNTTNLVTNLKILVMGLLTVGTIFMLVALYSAFFKKEVSTKQVILPMTVIYILAVTLGINSLFLLNKGLETEMSKDIKTEIKENYQVLNNYK